MTKPDAQRGTLRRNSATLEQLITLGAAQCGLSEVAQSFEATADGLDGHFERFPKARRAYEKAGADALARLRAAQFKLAETNATMAIFLGKQYLGQADRRELESSAQSAEDAFAVDAQHVRDKLAAILADRDPEADRGAGGEAE
jgi:hypothetical protein